MNENIIVTENNHKVLKHIIKVNKISKISEYENNGKKCAVLHFIDGLDIDEGYAALSTIDKLRVLETVSEIESLIMGKPTEEKAQDTTPYHHVSITADEDPIDYLSDKVNRLIYELDKSEKENTRLKAQPHIDKFNFDKHNELLEENANLKARLEHSNPANPCCRETFCKMDEFSRGMCKLMSAEELDDHVKLDKWRRDFLSKIQENKND